MGGATEVHQGEFCSFRGCDQRAGKLSVLEPGRGLPTAATVQTLPTAVAFPANLPALYEGLATQFKLVDQTSAPNTEGAPAPGNRMPDGHFGKYLPNSYRTAFNFTTPRTQFAKTGPQLSLRDQAPPPGRTRLSNNRPTILPGAARFCVLLCGNRCSLSESGCSTSSRPNLPSSHYFKDC